MAVSQQRVRAALDPVVSAAGYDLEDVSITQAGRRSVVRVIVDRDGGVDLDAVAEISRVISDVLDDDAVTGAVPFTLEVSSPGVDRPLSEPRHWRRAAGRLVQAHVTGEGSVTGRVVDADDRGVTFDVGGDKRTIAYDVLGAGKVQVEFNRGGE
jgi:ribosome maturation factor RimP